MKIFIPFLLTLEANLIQQALDKDSEALEKILKDSKYSNDQRPIKKCKDHLQQDCSRVIFYPNPPNVEVPYGKPEKCCEDIKTHYESIFGLQNQLEWEEFCACKQEPPLTIDQNTKSYCCNDCEKFKKKFPNEIILKYTTDWIQQCFCDKPKFGESTTPMWPANDWVTASYGPYLGGYLSFPVNCCCDFLKSYLTNNYWCPKDKIIANYWYKNYCQNIQDLKVKTLPGKKDIKKTKN